MPRTILVVDDEPDIRELARISMERVGGHHVLVARSGAEAVTLAADHRPDAVVMDVQMPGMDGPATLAELRKSHTLAELPVVFLTASVMESQVAALEALEVSGVLAKPFDPMTLPAQVAQLVGWTD